MTEDEYMHLSNLVRLREVSRILRDVLFLDGSRLIPRHISATVNVEEMIQALEKRELVNGRQ